jgi:hypothetical protein
MKKNKGATQWRVAEIDVGKAGIRKALLVVAVILFAAHSAVAQEQGDKPADKVSVELDFGASLLTADSEGVVDSMTDASLEDSKLGFSYEDELWGASASLKFASENLRFLSGEIGEMFAEPVLSLDELYGWVKPFGPVVKFTGGIFENTDGIADYTDDIDDYSMGVFIFGEDGEPFSKPEAEFTSPVLTNGFLTDLVFGSVTLQFLLGSNYSGDSASALATELMGTVYQMYGVQADPTVDTDERFSRLGGRVIIDAGVGTFAAVFKTFQWPMAVINPMEGLEGNGPFGGDKANWMTFGAYFDLTSVENLGLSAGYTGFLPKSDDGNADSVLYNGIDLRATWTGIEGLSLSTHNNISFAKGSKKDWMGILADDDASFFTLYNAIGATKELTEKFSVNAVLSNIYSKTDLGAMEASTDTFGVNAKFIAKVGENAEFNISAALDVSTSSASGVDDETVTTFSIPVGIKVSF